MRLLLIARTALRLGARNVLTVAKFRVEKKLGLHGRAVEVALPPGPLFVRGEVAAPAVTQPDVTIARARRIRAGELQIFGGDWVQLGSPYRWDENVLPLPWGEGDIKGLWEASRFGWALDLARAELLAPGQGLLDCLEAYTEGWLAAHPGFGGANWSCGQESSLRLIHLLLASRIVSGSPALTPRLAAVAALHLRRIDRTLGYAVAQDNNHGTSEAAALFIGGTLLGDTGIRWAGRGRRTLERLAQRLIMADGGFSQGSVNYHRVLLDTLSQVEFWRREIGAPEFSDGFYAKCRLATEWLAAVTNATNGTAPNLGANDGAWLYRLSEADYADYRPSTALTSTLFLERSLPGAADPLGWLGLRSPPAATATLSHKRSRLFPDWGLARLNPRADGGGAYAFVRFPVRRFRPAQADMLHFDLFTADGRNLLIDTGSFSYAHPDGIVDLTSIAAHNSIQFDGGEPMRRLGRFLFADWPNATGTTAIDHNGEELSWATSYRTWRGAAHRRGVRATGDRWTVEDEVSGFEKEATLRWHFGEQPYRLDGNRLETEDMILTVTGSSGDAQLLVEDTWTSPTYGHRERALVLVARFGAATRLVTTTIDLKR